MLGSVKRCHLDVLAKTCVVIVVIVLIVYSSLVANYSRFLASFQGKANQPSTKKMQPAPLAARTASVDVITTPTSTTETPVTVKTTPATVKTTPATVKAVPADVCGCFKSKNVSRIGILGDSQGFRYKNGLQSVLGVPCTTVRKEKVNFRLPEAGYYCLDSQKNCDEIVVHKRACSGCASQTSRCSCNSSLTLDYLAMEYVMDTEVTLRNDKSTHMLPDIAEREAHTTQEFIFKHMWSPVENRPDVILIFSTISHDLAVRRDEESFRRDLNWLLDLVAFYIQKWTERTVEVWYFNAPLVFEKKVAAGWKPITTNRKLTQYNAIFAEEYRKRVTMFPHIFKEAPNLLTISSSKSLAIFADSVHFKASWYDDILRKFVTDFCG